MSNVPNPYNSPYDTGAAAPLGPAPTIKNYLVESILVTLCCCIPLGIVAIVYASQVNSKIATGDYQGAQKSADSAKMWCLIGLACGVIGNLIAVVVQVLAASAQVQQGGF